MKFRGVLVAGATVAFCLAATGRVQAQAIVLEIPGVQGESTISGFINQIDVLSFSWGASRPCGGSISVADLNLTKNTDRSTVDLLTALRDATTFATVTFRFIRPDGQVYQKIDLANARLESGQTAGGGSDPRTTESWSFAFSQATVTYTYFDTGGKSGGSESTTIVSSACPGP